MSFEVAGGVFVGDLAVAGKLPEAAKNPVFRNSWLFNLLTPADYANIQPCSKQLKAASDNLLDRIWEKGKISGQGASAVWVHDQDA